MNPSTASFLVFLLLAGPSAKWKAGVMETSTYRHKESVMAGASTYTVSGALGEGHTKAGAPCQDCRRVFHIEVLTQRKLVLGGQEGNLETRGLTVVDAATFDFVESRLTTFLNQSEASSLRAQRKGSKIEVTQKLRGSPTDTRTVEAPGPVVEESALLFYVSRLPWKRGREFRWFLFSPAQGRLLHATARAEKEENQVLRVTVQTEIGPRTYHIRRGKPAVVLKTEAGSGDRLELEGVP